MRIETVHAGLQALDMRWALTGKVDAGQAAALRRNAARLNHAHYRARIPHYQRLCEVAGVDGDAVDLGTIHRELLIPDDIFKSYPARLLDEGDFDGMTEWVSRIGDRRVNGAARTARSLTGWLAALEQQGVHLVFSSGTSGHMSFVPRHGVSWSAFLELGFVYLPLLLARRGVVRGWRAAALRLLARTGDARRVVRMVQKVGLRDFDGFFLNFAGGNQGIQLVGQETARLTRRAVFLYPQKMSAAAVRALVRGPRTEDERELAEAFLRTTVYEKDAHYARVLEELRRSVRAGRKVILFGTPYLLAELCERVAAADGTLRLPRGSHVTFGGGWKSFTGERIPAELLLGRIAGTFDLPRHAIVEGYSMTEIHGLMLRCAQDRYHVPPHLETVILDDALQPLTGPDVTGALGILDPFARSYPGFLLTGDHVRRVTGSCACGLDGPAILEVARSPGKEVKGCGGIMAAVNA